ncbi:MAG: hypothetical protein ABSF66_00540 [Terriglobales bacterium]|jgi:hypothetical protein
MHRCGSGFLLALAITFAVALTGCLGKSSINSGNGGVTSVTLSPSSTISIEVGGTQVFSASGRDASGHSVLGINIQYVVGVPPGTITPPPLTININGNACAGTWDQTGSQCSAGSSGIATVNAVISGVYSPTTTVYVHQHIDSVQIIRLDPQGPPQHDCFSQSQFWNFEGVAYNTISGDITSSVGPITWSSSNSGVVTTTPIVSAAQPNVLNQVQVTAASPGITNLFASVSGVTSSPYPYTTCLIQAIYLQIGGQNEAGNSITVNNGASIPITAIAVDTLCGIANSTPLTKAPLTWSTTNPEVAAFSSTTSSAVSNSAAARNNLGGTTLFASCTPPSCNIGVLPSLPIYASDYNVTDPPKCQPPNVTKAYGTISVDVTSASKVATYTAWAATTDCGNASGCTSALFAVTPGTTPIGTIVSVPRTPNSMMFNHLSSARLYLGSDQGLMYMDTTAKSGSTVSLVSSTSIPCNVALCGQVLTISNDGKLVVVSDTVSTPSQVYIYNGGSGAFADLIIPGETATAAAFSPDQLKLFILTNAGNMYVYSTADPLTSVPIATSATDVKFSADGSFAYIAGTPTGASISAFATCNPQLPQGNLGRVPTPGIPLQLFPAPDAQHVIAIDPPNIDVFTGSDTQNALVDGHFTCNAPSVTFGGVQSFNLGQGNFTPLYGQLVADGTEVILVAQKIPAVLLFNVSSGTTTSIPLVGGSTPLSASASTDGSQVYVAACDQYTQINPPPAPPTCTAGSVHIVCTGACTKGQGDFQQVPYANINNDNNPNMCNSLGGTAPLCLPNLVAIRPQ